MKVQKECDAVRIAELLGVENHKLAVVLDWQCENSSRFLAEVRKSYIHVRKPFLGQLRAHREKEMGQYETENLLLDYSCCH